MKLTYIYPGSFCPPTYGHYQSVLKAASMFDRLYIVCSANPHKHDQWFTPEQCVELWQRAYSLPANVAVTTITEIKKLGLDLSQVVIVRGIRNENHFVEEKGVVFLNYQQLGIDKFFYLVSDDEHNQISSSKARNLAVDMELEKLSDYVAPLVISALLEHVLQVKNLFMVVGRPGSGKSTFFRMLHDNNPQCIHLNTDEINEELKPLLRQVFGHIDLVKLALTDEMTLKAVIAKPWLALLKERLSAVTTNSSVYVEIPYGLQPDKCLFRFVGGKVIYYQVGNGSNERDICQARLIRRGTPSLVPFIDLIPDWEQSQLIANMHNLAITKISAPEELNKLEQSVMTFQAEME